MSATPCAQPDDAPLGLGAHALTILAGCSYRQLDWWTRTGLVASIDQEQRGGDAFAPGSGVPRVYAPDQANLVVEMAALVRVGIAPRLARALALQVINTGRAALGDFTVGRAS